MGSATEAVIYSLENQLEGLLGEIHFFQERLERMEKKVKAQLRAARLASDPDAMERVHDELKRLEKAPLPLDTPGFLQDRAARLSSGV